MNFFLLVYLVVAEVVPAFSIASNAVQICATVAIRASACRLIVPVKKTQVRKKNRGGNTENGRNLLVTVNVGRIIKRLVSSLNRSPPSLILKVPIETCKRTMLGTFVLEEKRTLIYARIVEF